MDGIAALMIYTCMQAAVAIGGFITPPAHPPTMAIRCSSYGQEIPQVTAYIPGNDSSNKVRPQIARRVVKRYALSMDVHEVGIGHLSTL